MRTFLPVVVLVLLVVGLVWVTDGESGDPIAAIDAAYAKHNGSGQYARQSLALAEQAFAAGGGFEAAWRAARACFWICDRSENEKIDVEFGKKGWDWGLKAKELNPQRVEGHYYACICLGEYSKGIGIAKALFKRLGGKYEVLGNRAVALDAGFDRAGPLRAMGRYYQKLPRPARNLDRAEDYYKKAEAMASCMTRTRFYLVELYMEREDWNKAKTTGEAALSAPACPEHVWECNHYKELIKNLLARMPTA